MNSRFTVSGLKKSRPRPLWGPVSSQTRFSWKIFEARDVFGLRTFQTSKWWRTSGRLWDFCLKVKCPLYVVHVMSKSAAKVIMEKRKEGAVSLHIIILYSSACERQCWQLLLWHHCSGDNGRAYCCVPGNWWCVLFFSHQSCSWTASEGNSCLDQEPIITTAVGDTPLLMSCPLLSGFQRMMSLPLLQYGYRCIHHMGRMTFKDI